MIGSHMTQENGSSSKQLPTREFLRQIEENAMVLRERAGVGPSERLDPFACMQNLGIQVQYADKVPGLTTEEISFIQNTSVKDWSGVLDSRRLPNGKLLIMLHPGQTIERANVTVMEEVAHDHYGHRPVVLDGSRQGRYDEYAEQEAYWTAAAALLPMKDVGQAVWQKKTVASLAKEFGVSEQLVEMRIKILGLWKKHQSVQ